MYKIIGADQKEYGPVTSDQIRQWIADQRANAQTRARAEGETEWKTLAEFPEFADALGRGAAAPAPSPSPLPAAAPFVGGREAALSAVKGPAIALIITAALGMAYYAFSAIVAVITHGSIYHRELPPNVPPELRSFLENLQGPMAGLINLVIVGLDAVVLFGAIKMMKLEKRGLAFAACIIAMIPCQCCCLFGLPFGIWGLVMLNKPEVKSQFT